MAFKHGSYVMTTFCRIVLIGTLTAFLAACGSSQPPLGSVGETYNLVDNQGRKSGTVTFSPLGQGELRDNGGKLIGKIVAP
jgi:hypothetical protein